MNRSIYLRKICCTTSLLVVSHRMPSVLYSISNFKQLVNTLMVVCEWEREKIDFRFLCAVCLCSGLLWFYPILIFNKLGHFQSDFRPFCSSQKPSWDVGFLRWYPKFKSLPSLWYFDPKHIWILNIYRFSTNRKWSENDQYSLQSMSMCAHGFNKVLQYLPSFSWFMMKHLGHSMDDIYRLGCCNSIFFLPFESGKTFLFMNSYIIENARFFITIIQ